MNLEKELKTIIKEIPDFPKPGISFKDITPILAHPELYNRCLQAMKAWATTHRPDYIAGIESRGFIFGFTLARDLQLPFIPLRKPGKLPRDVYSHSYDLEYGSATLELHKDDIKPGSRVIIHDDLLATGGTANAAIQLISNAGSEVVGLQFLVELLSLDASKKFPSALDINSLVSY